MEKKIILNPYPLYMIVSGEVILKFDIGITVIEGELFHGVNQFYIRDIWRSKTFTSINGTLFINTINNILSGILIEGKNKKLNILTDGFNSPDYGTLIVTGESSTDESIMSFSVLQNDITEFEKFELSDPKGIHYKFDPLPTKGGNKTKGIKYSDLEEYTYEVDLRYNV